MKSAHFLMGLFMTVAACASPAASSGPDNRPAKDDSMMVIRVIMDIKPEHDEAFRAYFADETEAVRKLDGCLRYELFAAADQAHTYLLYEEWASAEDFRAYQQSPMLKKSFQVLGPMMAGRPNSAYYDGTKVGP